MNFIAAGFVFIGTCFDVGTWYYSKDVEVFDNEENEGDDMEDEKEQESVELTPIKSNEK